MNVIYYLIPVAVLFVIIGVVVFFWATRSDQFEDLEKHGFSILSDDDDKSKNKHQSNDKNQ